MLFFQLLQVRLHDLDPHIKLWQHAAILASGDNWAILMLHEDLLYIDTLVWGSEPLKVFYQVDEQLRTLASSAFPGLDIKPPLLLSTACLERPFADCADLLATPMNKAKYWYEDDQVDTLFARGELKCELTKRQLHPEQLQSGKTPPPAPGQ